MRFYKTTNPTTGKVAWTVNREDAIPSGFCTKRIVGNVLEVHSLETGEIIANAEYWNYTDKDNNPYPSLAALEDATFDFFVKAPVTGSGGLEKYNSFAGLPVTGSDNVVYYTKDTKLLYVWNGVSYDEVPEKELTDYLTVVANYPALPNPTTVPNKFYWCSASQGTAWLPGALGGTFYNSGMYYSNGTSWEYLKTPYQATQVEVDAGLVTDKFVTPVTLASTSKWATKQDAITPLTELVVKSITSDASKDSKEPTGFVDGSNITTTYNSVARTVTLTGTVKGYFRGKQVTILTNNWTSAPHPATVDNYFLYYNGTDFIWSTTLWSFDMLQIVFVSKNGFAIRETHALMPWEVHKHLHQTVGTYLVSGGDMSNFTLSSTTAANRRPNISITTVNDEDLQSPIAALTDKAYTVRSLTGTGVSSVTINNAEIIPVVGSVPYFNFWNTTAWVQQAFPTNHYAAIFVIAVPVTEGSLSYRYQFIQPQQTSSSLTAIQALVPANLNFGDAAETISEFVFIGKIIVRYTGGNWSLFSVEKTFGSRASTVNVQGTYLSSVTTSGANLSGTGTASNPLTFVNVDGWIDYNDSATAITPISVTANVPTILTNNGAGLYSQNAAAPLNVTQLWNTATNRFDFSQLSVYDEVGVRVEIEVTTTVNNAQWWMFIRFDIGGTQFDAVINSRSYYKTSGTYTEIVFFPFYIGRESMRVNPSALYFQSDSDCTVIVKGFYITVKQR